MTAFPGRLGRHIIFFNYAQSTRLLHFAFIHKSIFTSTLHFKSRLALFFFLYLNIQYEQVLRAAFVFWVSYILSSLDAIQ